MFENRALPLPRPIFFLTLLTAAMSLVIFIVGMLDLGTAGFFLNVAAAAATLIHDVSLIFYARHFNPNQTPIFFPAAASWVNIIFLGACALIYTAGFAMTVFSTVFVASGEISWGTPADLGTVIAQDVLVPLCALIILYIAGWCIKSRMVGRQYGYENF